jgi:hypothetical protein
MSACFLAVWQDHFGRPSTRLDGLQPLLFASGSEEAAQTLDGIAEKRRDRFNDSVSAFLLGMLICIFPLSNQAVKREKIRAVARGIHHFQKQRPPGVNTRRPRETVDRVEPT